MKSEIIAEKMGKMERALLEALKTISQLTPLNIEDVDDDMVREAMYNVADRADRCREQIKEALRYGNDTDGSH